MPGWVPATGWRLSPMNPTVPSSACPPAFPASPTSLPSPSTTTASSMPSARPPRGSIRRARGAFAVFKRRCTNTGEAQRSTLIGDSGHRPAEIAAVLRAARQAYGGSGRVIAVMQPHRYTRLAALKAEFATCFADADVVLIAEVYAAGETALAGVNRDMLVGLVRRARHRDV